MARTIPINYTNTQVTGTLSAVNGTVVIAAGVFSTIGIHIGSASAVGANVVFEATVDGTTWVAISAFPINAAAGVSVTAATAAGEFEVNAGSFQSFRVRMTAITSGNMPITLNGTLSTKHIRVSNKQAADLQVTTTPSTSTLVDRSGTVTTGGTAQALMAANAVRKGWRLQNTGTSNLWFNDTGTAATAGGAGSFKLTPGSYFESPLGGQSQTAISILGGTTAQPFSASEW